MDGDDKDEAFEVATKKLRAAPLRLGNAVESATPAELWRSLEGETVFDGDNDRDKADIVFELLVFIGTTALIVESDVIDDGEADKIQNILDKDSSRNALIRARIDEIITPNAIFLRSVAKDIGMIAKVINKK